MHAVDRYETSKQQDSFDGGRVCRTALLICKDGQCRKFSCTRPAHEEKALTEEFHFFSRRFYEWSYGSGPADEAKFAKVRICMPPRRTFWVTDAILAAREYIYIYIYITR